MPPEPFPWDRKDFFRERKHQNNGYDRVSAPLGGGSVSRWRDSPSHGSRNEFGRWGVPSDFRRPPGRGKQSSWHLYHEDLSHEYSTTRSGDRFFQDGGGFRPSGPYRDGRCNRNFRENRASFNQKDWRGHSWDYNNNHNMPPSFPGRSYNGNDQRLVDGPSARVSYPHSDEANTSAQFHSKEHPDEPCGLIELDMDQTVQKENSQASSYWKPFKWSRSGSSTSRGSGFNLLSSSQSAGESCDLRIEVPPKIATPDESSSGDALGCLASPTSLEDTTSRKKPRLGWGEGLAKFEKKRVEDPDDSQMKSSSTLCTRNTESVHSPAQNLADKSLKPASSLECRSPVTPASVPFTSSPGLDDKSYVKPAEINSDPNNLSLPPAQRYQNHFEELSPSLENKEDMSLFNLNGLLNELFQNEDQSLVDSGFIKNSAVNKLLLLKGDILKALELTESEIDSLENELKLLKGQPGSNSPCPESSSSMSLDCKEEPGPVLNMVQRPPLLKVDSSGDVINMDMVPCGNNFEESPKIKDEYDDSPGTATSKFMEPLFSDKFLPVDQQKHGLPGYDMVGGESSKYEVSSSVDLQNVAGSSASDSESKLAKDGNAPGLEYVAAFNNLEGCEFSSILACNKETATRAPNLFSNLLPCSSCAIESVEAISARCSPKISLIKEKFLKRQHSLRFKERTLCLKYRVLQHLWKEDLQLLSERKYRAKSQKKVESGYRSLHGSSQKHRPTIRLWVSSPACNLSFFPSSEVASFMGKQLSDPQNKCYRNSLKMPALILDKKEKMLSRFLSNNGFVQDPCALEGERALVNPWTAEEKEIFVDNYATFGKDFKKISSFLGHKTIADCVEFYYKNHKSEFFKKTKQQELKKQEKSALATRYLMTSGKKWNKEMNAVSLDMLGVASAIVGNDDKDMKSLKVFSRSGCDRKLRGNDGIRDTSSSYDTEDGRETEAADVLASICGSLSSEAMSSCITSSADPGEGSRDWKFRKASSEPYATRCPPTAEVTRNVDDDTCSDESCGCLDPIDWTDEEKTNFVQAFSTYGKDFVMISRCVQTKSRDQCRVFFSKARKCLGLEMLCQVLGNEEISAADDQDEGQSDAEDACVVEDDLATRGDRSSDRTDECEPVNASNIKWDHDDNPMNLYDEVDISDECVPVQLDENVLKRRSQMLLPQNSQPEVTPEVVVPDESAMLNEGVKNEVISQYSENGDLSVASVVGEETFSEQDRPMNTNAVIGAAKTEIASEKPEPDSKGGGQDNHNVSFTSFSYECRRDKQVKRSASANDLHQPLPMSNCSSHFSMQMEVSVVASHLQPSTRPCVSRRETSIQPLQVYLKKCHRSASVHSVGELPLRSKNHSQRSGSVSHRQSSPNTLDKTRVNGGVKLFGQILSKSSTMDKPASDSRDSSNSSSGCEGRSIYCPSTNSSIDALSVNNDTDKHAHNVSLGLENFPVRSNGLCDGNGIQTGYASLPDSTLLPKYLPAFASPSLSTSPLLQPVQSVNADKSSNGSLAEFQQVYPSKQNLHPYRLEMKQQDMLPNVSRSGFEAVSGMQQVKLNVVQSEIRAGGSCNGLTDPVTALKLHYAKAKQQGVSHGAAGGRVEEAWRGQNEDVGR